jgi:8-oxo-dGTP pyrophosphatase MutT (NUDIX family)
MADHENDNIFQISVKGLVFDDQGKVLMTLDEEGYWDPFGGRIQKGEDMIEALIRECKEETGLDCEVLDERPLIVYSSIDISGRGRAMVYYKAKLENLNFTPSDECLDMKFYTKEELKILKIAPQTKPLLDHL